MASESPATSTLLRRLFEVTGGEEQVETGVDLFDSLRSEAPDLLDQPSLSTVKTWETLTTLFLGKFASPWSSRTLPGASPRFRLEVIAQTTTVPIRLRLKRSF